MHVVLEDVIRILHNAGRRSVWIKTDGYVPARLNPGDMDFAERFPADWLANYIYQEAVLGMNGFILGAPDRKKVINIFFMFDDFNTVIHLSAYRDSDRKMDYARTV
jgi:hypothetical protein